MMIHCEKIFIFRVRRLNKPNNASTSTKTMNAAPVDGTELYPVSTKNRDFDRVEVWIYDVTTLCRSKMNAHRKNTRPARL